MDSVNHLPVRIRDWGIQKKNKVVEIIKKHHPKWHQNAKIMRTAAVALIVLGVVFAGAALVGIPIVFKIFMVPLAGAHIVMLGPLCIAIGLITLGAYCSNKIYWDDPKEVVKIRKKCANLHFDQIVERYGWDRTCTTILTDPPLRKEKFCALVREHQLSYQTIELTYGQKNRDYHFYDNESIHRLLLERAKNTTLASFISHEGGPASFWQLFLESEGPLLTCNDIREQFGKEMKEFPLEEILKNFSNEIYNYDLLPAKIYHQQLVQELEHMDGGLFVFLEKYSAAVITKGVMDHADPKLKEKFVQMMKEKPFHQMVCLYESLFTPELGLVPQEWKVKVGELAKVYHEEVKMWNSPECNEAKQRYRAPNNFEYYSSSPGTPPTQRIRNPDYYPYAKYAHQIYLDDHVRRPKRIQELLNGPWKAFTAK